MKRQLLKTRTGCIKCKERKKKCDEARPTCTSCLRLGLACQYPKSVDQQPSRKSSIDVEDAQIIAGTETNFTSLRESQHQHALMCVSGYDDPSVLQGSATSIFHERADKDAFLYICEAGANIVRYPTQLFPGFSNINAFRMGFQMARHFSPQVHAYLAISTAHRSKAKQDNSVSSITHYTAAMSGIRADLQKYSCPREWTCATAALLSVYELVNFSTIQNRLIHLQGFNNLVEYRLARSLPWGPFTLLVDHYCHSFVINILPHFNLFAASKDIDYVGRVLTSVRGKSHAMGSEVVGIPEQLVIAVYKLSFLTYQDTTQSPWDVELLGVSKKVKAWSPSSRALALAADGLLLVGRLYHSACICYCWYLYDKEMSLSSPKLTSLLDQVTTWLQISAVHERPYVCIAWPLVILGMFAVSDEHRRIIERPLQGLIKVAYLSAYQPAIDFLHDIWRLDIGPRGIHRPELLAKFML